MEYENCLNCGNSLENSIKSTKERGLCRRCFKDTYYERIGPKICEICNEEKKYTRIIDGKITCRSCHDKILQNEKNFCEFCNKEKSGAFFIIFGIKICERCFDKYLEEKFRCPGCNRIKLISSKGLCKNCYEKKRTKGKKRIRVKEKKKCEKCGGTEKVAKRKIGGTLCLKCYKEIQICSNCNERNKVNKIENGKFICVNCYEIPEHFCYICNERSFTKSMVSNEYVCRHHYEQERNENDANYRTRNSLRKRFHAATKKKVKGSFKYGINFETIISHLGPCPGNPKDYHIDHIIPLSSFDFTDPIQIKVAFAPINHQWLLKEDNLKKKAKYNEIDKILLYYLCEVDYVNMSKL